MRQAVITGPRRVEWVSVEPPPLHPGWALVKILTAPLCTEYKAFVRGTPTPRLGHEAAGEVVAVAPGSTVAVGDRVVVMPQYSCGVCPLCRAGDYIYCRSPLPYAAGALAEYIAKPSWLLARLPDTLSTDRGALACCALGPSFGAMERLGVNRFTTVLVTGLGPVGLGAVVNGVYRGARVIGVDANPYRADLARRLGAAVVLDPRDPHILEQIRAATGGQGVEAGVDCAGVVAAHRLQIDAAAQRAHLVWVGECQDPTPVQASADLIRKGLTLEGSWHYNLNDIPRVLRVAEEAPGSAQLVTHIYGRDALGEALATSAQQDCGKVLWHPWDEAPGGAVAGLP